VQVNRPSPQEQHTRAVEQRDTWQHIRAGNWQSDHRDWRHRGGYNGYVVPTSRFSLYFGPSHYFRIYSWPVVIYGGYPRFQYEGYWVSILDPWPEYWDPYWYENDDCYIEYYYGGYYLVDRRYSGVRLAVSISLG
jgi:hypothetical protein